MRSDPRIDEAAQSTPTVAEIEIVEATILGRDAATGQEWRIDQLNVAAHPNEIGAWQATGGGVLSLAAAAAASSPNADAFSEPPSPDVGRFKFQLHGAAAGHAARHHRRPPASCAARALARPHRPRQRGSSATTSADLKLGWATQASPALD